MAAPRSPEIHKALADDTRFRLYRYIRLAARPVSVPEMSARLSLHPNTIRPHLRRLEEAGLVTHEIRKGGKAGRPRTMYLVSEPADEESRDYRLLAEMLCGLVTGTRAIQRAHDVAREWGAYLIAQGKPKPGSRPPAGVNLALLQEAMARAGFDPRFRRTGGKGRRDHPAGVPVPGPGRRASRAGVHAPPGAAGGDRRRRDPAPRHSLVQAVRRAGPLLGRRELAAMAEVVVRPLRDADRDWASDLLRAHWGARSSPHTAGCSPRWSTRARGVGGRRHAWGC